MTAERIAVLIVDDDPHFVELLRSLLDTVHLRTPFDVHCVASGDAALREIRRQPYQLVLLDNHLPGQDGLDVLQQLGGLPASHQPAVIMLTAAGNEEVAVEAMKRGAKDYLSKLELSPPALHRAITSALQQRWLERQLQEKTEHLAADLRMAREVQLAFLPQTYPTFPATATPAQSALQFSHRYLPSDAIGGDFFDVLALTDHAAGVLICDVAGHGLRAALVTAILRGLVEELRAEARDPGRFLGAINRGLREILRATKPPLFATAFYLVADVARGELRYATAGHPWPFHLPRATADLAILGADHDGRGPALGVLDDEIYRTLTCPLRTGDRILLYTDGLFEVEMADGQLYGEERLQAAVHQHRALPANQLLDQVVADVQAAALDHQFTDDVCVVGIEVARLETQ